MKRFPLFSLNSSFSSKEPIPHSSTPHSKMETDLRYKPINSVPQSLLEHSDKIYSPGFSIKGEARVGRPAYLDFQATTPLDPRVLDSMVIPSFLILSLFSLYLVYLSLFFSSFLISLEDMVILIQELILMDGKLKLQLKHHVKILQN